MYPLAHKTLMHVAYLCDAPCYTFALAVRIKTIDPSTIYYGYYLFYLIPSHEWEYITF